MKKPSICRIQYCPRLQAATGDLGKYMGKVSGRYGGNTVIEKSHKILGILPLSLLSY